VLEELGMSYLGDNPQGYYYKSEPIPTHEYEMSRVTWQNWIKQVETKQGIKRIS